MGVVYLFGTLTKDFHIPLPNILFSPSKNLCFAQPDILLSRLLNKYPYRKNTWESGPGIYWFRLMEYQKSRVRCKVEYVFHIIKDVFGFRKTRYRGLRKLEAVGNTLFASANLYMIWKGQQLAANLNASRPIQA